MLPKISCDTCLPTYLPTLSDPVIYTRVLLMLFQSSCNSWLSQSTDLYATHYHLILAGVQSYASLSLTAFHIVFALTATVDVHHLKHHTKPNPLCALWCCAHSFLTSIFSDEFKSVVCFIIFLLSYVRYSSFTLFSQLLLAIGPTIYMTCLRSLSNFWIVHTVLMVKIWLVSVDDMRENTSLDNTN